MLYDPKWEVEVKADPHSLGSLITWLEKRDRREVYNYGCNGSCLLALYYQSKGFRRASMGSETWHWRDENGRVQEGRIPKHFNWIAWGGPQGDRTFGGALKRAHQCAN